MIDSFQMDTDRPSELITLVRFLGLEATYFLIFGLLSLAYSLIDFSNGIQNSNLMVVMSWEGVYLSCGLGTSILCWGLWALKKWSYSITILKGGLGIFFGFFLVYYSSPQSYTEPTFFAMPLALLYLLLQVLILHSLRRSKIKTIFGISGVFR